MSNTPDQTLDGVIVGAGFAGLYMLHRLRGLGFTARIFEAGDGVGGTWFWNRYPGARCDIESLEYSYTFSEELDREWLWTERYASQPEILRYLNHVADRFDLRRDIQLNTRVTSAIYDEAADLWRISTEHNPPVSARFCIMATGCLSVPKLPEYPGIDTFQGKSYHTGAWPHEGVDFTGERVAVIGSGSSAIQSVPVIAQQASHLYVFQRTANFSVPAHNGPISSQEIEDWKTQRAVNRDRARYSVFGSQHMNPSETMAVDTSPEERERTYELFWQRGGLAIIGAFGDLIVNREANDTAADFVRAKIRAILNNPDVADKLAPRDYPLGTKRLCVDTNYYDTFNRGNVTLIDTRSSPIQATTPTGIRTSDGDYEVDSIVFATGFDAMTGALSHIDIQGRTGLTLKEKWAAGPRTYLGLMVAGFPNLFTITGPGSPSVLSNMIVSIEQHVDWIADCLAYLRNEQACAIEANIEAENDWVNHVNEVANQTLFPLANSWYVGANVPGKPRVFMPYIGGVGPYRQKCEEVAANNYQGFILSGQAVLSQH